MYLFSLCYVLFEKKLATDYHWQEDVFVCTELTLSDWLFLQGMVLVWESYKLDPYVQKLAEAVFNFQEKVQ